MGLLFRLAELLIVIVPLATVIIAAVKAFSANQRQQPEPPTEPAERSRGTSATQWASIKRVINEHSRTDARWVEYELDAAKLLDFPLMTDMRDPLTMRFHKAKLKADFLRPAKAEDLLDDREAANEYFAAVQEYVAAFDAAEAEAIRRRRTDFSENERQRMTRAQSLLRVASDSGATQQERQRAYDLARKELEGLIVLPAAIQRQIERGVFGELDG
ncbi:hypothetical protein MSP7336_03372 [Mycobacterium shimoidei]|uniref:Uncharacterized protein n=1 Tax=Mycobacterium shimoidei TaxID=29313 RepID=A0A375Z1T3_MYCSH|nr:hypothetical protein [Mycobacterium shimoidei]SRX95108.1 hypothetical protein MSP7336_03372 [Mycobacterium shimoidei]